MTTHGGSTPDSFGSRGRADFLNPCEVVMTPPDAKRLIVLMLLLVGAAPVWGSDGDWPQWRGPTRDGHAGGNTWPTSLSADNLTLAWRVELGPSYSGPIVVGDRVFTTETRGKKTEVASAYNRRTGERLWSIEWPGAMRVPFFAAANGSWIRATPACDGDTLYVAGIRDVLVALDTASGDERWRVDFTERFGTSVPSFGCASSPVVEGDAVYVQAGDGFVKLDKSTGETAWRLETGGGGMSGGAFSSPLMASLGGKQLAVVQTRLELKGVEPDSGQEQWSQPIAAFRGMNILTPILYNGAVFTSAHTGRSQLWRLGESADGGGLAEVWSNKSQAYMSSPVIVDDHLYLHLRNQRVQCIDLATGEEAWRSRPFGKYQSMAVLPAGPGGEPMILSLDERGELLLIKATPKAFELVDSRKVSQDEAWAHIAVCGGQVFVRELNALAAYDWR
ncbi:MAG: PQQ-binding-like beta-propeller repeat protein [Planctomycetota bacterium]